MSTVVLSLGGSVIVPDEIDVGKLKELKKIILDYISIGNKVAILCGGGKTCRKYQKAACEIGASALDLDWIGTMATRLNAELVRSIFSDTANKEVLYDPTKKLKQIPKILVAAGWKPGWSTDYDAVVLAENINADTVVNMTNVDYVYNKNPKEFIDAKKLENITWEDFLKIVGNEWKPGLNAPFDPVASKKASELRLIVNIIGSDIDNLRNLLDGKKFKGTVIGSKTQAFF